VHVVRLSEQAHRFLKRLDVHRAEIILRRLQLLDEESVPSDAKFVGRCDGKAIFRLRIGKDYRALYFVKTDMGVVIVTKIDKRSRIYG
jgi:mRNA-degrading endonuclease RelE of RelBE toxin-antitoxin system